MKALAAAIALVLAACGGPVPPWPEPPAVALDLRLSVTPGEPLLLAEVTVHLDLYRRADLPVEFAPTVDPEAFASTVEVAPEVALGPGRWQRTTLRLRPLRPGELLLPSFRAAAKDGTVAATTPEQRLQVRSALAGHGEAIEAPAEPLAAPASRWPWLLLPAAALVAAALWRWQRTRRRAPMAAAVALPPHVLAQRELARLQQAPRTTPAEIERFYVEVSQVLRNYLEARFGLRAPERTTEEFLRDLESGAALAREHRAELERFLSQCDLVKFAAVVPGEAEHQRTFASAAAFVEATRADRVPAAAGAEGAA